MTRRPQLLILLILFILLILLILLILYQFIRVKYQLKSSIITVPLAPKMLRKIHERFIHNKLCFILRTKSLPPSRSGFRLGLAILTESLFASQLGFRSGIATLMYESLSATQSGFRSGIPILKKSLSATQPGLRYI